MSNSISNPKKKFSLPGGDLLSSTMANMSSSVIAKLVNNANVENFGHLLTLASKMAVGDAKTQMANLAKLCEDKDPMVEGWLRALKGLSPNCRKKLINNLIFNHSVIGDKIRVQQGDIHGTNIPFLVLISPTYACNLECVGCYSALYGDKYHITREEMYDLLQQFYDLGVRFFTFTGGEPFVSPYLMDLFRDFDDCFFMVYTNGTLLKESRVKKLAEYGNVAVTISIEGWEEYHDWRRGEGVFQKDMQAYKLLREHGILCGASIMATSKNHDELMDNKFWDFLSEQGVEYAWVFQYMPVGRGATFDLVPTPKQRYERFHKIEQMRTEGKYAFIADFWNHGFLVNGCMSGGANYLHINAKGGAEPCVFQQYAVDNIRDKRVIDILKSKFFEGYKKDIPFNDNLMQPCPIIDNPDKFREHIKECGATPQHEGSDSYFDFTDELNSLSKEWEKYAIKIWKDEGYGNIYKAEHNQYSHGHSCGCSAHQTPQPPTAEN